MSAAQEENDAWKDAAATAGINLIGMDLNNMDPLYEALNHPFENANAR
jgi:hypothetical protein